MLRLLRHYFYFVPAQLSKAKGIGKNILLKLQLVIRISLTAISNSTAFGRGKC